MSASDESKAKLTFTSETLQEFFAAKFQSYLAGERQNKLDALNKEIEQLQSILDEQVELSDNSAKIGKIIVKHQEQFYHKSGILAKSTRTVGVNVNISFGDDQSIANTVDAPKSPEMKTTSMILQTDSKTGLVSKHAVNKSNALVVDLTGEEEKKSLKYFKASEGAHAASPTRQAANVSSVAKMQTNASALSVPFPNNSVLTSAPTMPPMQRIAYMLSPNSQLLRGIVPNSRVTAMTSSRNSGAVIMSTSKPPGHIITGQATIASFPPPLRMRHPAPLPNQFSPFAHPSGKVIPPKPILKLSNPKNSGIMLQWNMALIPSHAKIKAYQIYGYEETVSGPIDSSIWKKVGEVKALPLPMACALSQYADGRCYHFSIRAVDVYSRNGPFSDVASISLPPPNAN